MRSFSIALAYTAIISFGFSGCMVRALVNGNGMHHGPMGMMMQNNSVDMTTEEVHDDAIPEPSASKSYVITKRYCSQCHELKSPKLHEPQQWEKTIGRMLEYMKRENHLQPDAYEKIMIEHYYGIDSKENLSQQDSGPSRDGVSLEIDHFSAQKAHTI